jgi:hypothetical protein
MYDFDIKSVSFDTFETLRGLRNCELIENACHERDMVQYAANTISSLGFDAFALSVASFEKTIQTSVRGTRYTIPGPNSSFCAHWGAVASPECDPFLEHAGVDSSVQYSRSIRPLNSAQQGFLSNLEASSCFNVTAVPNHLSPMRTAVLYLGTSVSTPAPTLSASQAAGAKLTCASMSTWFLTQKRREFCGRFDLDERDVVLLQCAHGGMGSKDLARRLGRSEVSLKRSYSRIVSSLQVKSRTEAATLAFMQCAI